MVIHQRGLVHQQLDDQESAIADFDTALPLVPEPHVTYAARGTSYLLSDRKPLAIRDLSEAIERAPGVWAYWYFRGIAHEANDNPQAALSDYENAAWLEPSNAELMTHKANLRADLGDYEGAVEDHSMAIKLDPDNASSLNGRAWNLYLLERNLDGALEDARRANALEPDAFHITDTMAHVLSGLGRREEAMTWFDRAFELGGEWAITWYQRELAAKGYYTGAIDGQAGPQTRSAMEACVHDDCRLLAGSEP